MDKWVAIVEDGNGKIHIFTKYTDNTDAFLYEVKGWNVGTVLVVYREKDIVQNTSL